MALPDVIINQLSGGSGRPLPGYDYYSGLIFYGNAPAVAGKWATYIGTPSIKYQQMFSADDATSAGIVPFTDNTAAAGVIAITRGATGDTIKITATVPRPNGGTFVVNLGTYTQLVTDATSATLAASIAAMINATTVTTGYSANAVGVNITFTFPKSEGIGPNTGNPIATTMVGAIATVITQPSASTLGTASQWAIWAYHISEYFRVNNTGNLTVGIIAASSSFNEVQTLQKAASSKLRQIGIYDTDTGRAASGTITGTITQLQAACIVLQKKSPLSAFYSPNIAAIADLSTYPDQNLNTANKVQTILSQDGAAAGAQLFVVSGQTIGNIGAKLGSISKSRVSASDAQPIPDFNMSDGVENNIPAFGNGTLSVNVSEGLQTQLDNYNYTFFRQFGDTVVGTYWTGNKCCIVSTSDYANVNDNRVSDKVSRILYSTYIPLLNSELIFNADGTLQQYTIETFVDAGEDAISANMITGFGSLPLISGRKITIDPTQPVKQTSNLTVSCVIIENGIARKITVNIAYGTSI